MISLKEISKYRADAWYVEHVPARPLMVSGIVRGFVDGLKLRSYSMVLAYYKRDELDWITLKEDQDKIGREIFRKYRGSRNYWSKEIKKWLLKKKRLENNFEKLRKKELDKVPDKEIAADIRRYSELQWETRKTDSLVDPFMFSAEKMLTGLLDDLGKKDKNFNPKTALAILTLHDEPSFVNSAELELIKIAKDVKKNAALRKKFFSGNIDEEEIKKSSVYKRICSHLERFTWLNVESFYGARPYAFSDAAGSIRELLDSDLKKKEEENMLWRNNKKTRNDFISKNKFSKDILMIAELSPIFARWQDMRKECTLMTTYLHSKYLKELSRRKYIDEDELAYLDYSEIEAFLKGSFDVSQLKKRRYGCMFVFQKNKFQVFYGDEAETVVNRIINPAKKETAEIKGVCASPGTAKGIVKIVARQQDIVKVNEGDIIVSAMTRPEHIPAMKRASAIVTNEGGVTCHAAVLSRELGKPCIISTKIATKVLKDGDLVEVDADKGVVRKIG